MKYVLLIVLLAAIGFMVGAVLAWAIPGPGGWAAWRVGVCGCVTGFLFGSLVAWVAGDEI